MTTALTAANPSAPTPDHAEALRQAAQAAADLGYHLVALHGVRGDGTCTCGKATCSPGKHPRSGSWQIGPGTLQRFRLYTDGMAAFNLGLRLDADSPVPLVLLDVDTKHGKPGLASLAQLESKCGALPDGALLQTTPSGGRHFLLRLPVGVNPRTLPNSTDVLPGLDVLTDGRQFVLAPSRTTVGAYTFVNGRGLVAPTDLPILPASWVESLMALRGATGGTSGATSDADPAPDASRLVKLLNVLPAPQANSRDECVDFAFAVHGAAANADPEVRVAAEEAWYRWAGRWSGADPAKDQLIWESTSGSKHRGWRHVLSDGQRFISRARGAPDPDAAGVGDGADLDAAEEMLYQLRAEDAQSAFPADPNMARPDGVTACGELAETAKLEQRLTAVRDAPSALARLLAIHSLRKDFSLTRVEIERAAASLTAPDASGTDTGFLLAELLARPELLMAPAPAIPYLAWPGLKTLLSAREKTGKSTLALAGAAAATRGAPFLDEAASAQSVLWVTEEPLGVLVRRASDMRADPTRFVILPMGRNPAQQLQRAWDRWSPQIVVIDTLYRYAGVEDENDSAGWLPVFAQFDEITRSGAALLLLVHATKASKGGEYRGSSAIGGHVDLILAMTAPDSGAVRKVRAVGRIPLSDFEVRLTPDRSSFELFGRGDQDAETVREVRAFLAANGLSTRSRLRRELHVGQPKVDAALERLVGEGAAIQDNGRYRLVTAPEEFGRADAPPDGVPHTISQARER